MAAIITRLLVGLIALAGCKEPAKEREAPAPPPRDGANAPPIPGWPELAGLVLAQPVWVMELGPRAPRPELVAHPPVVVGERVIVAGSRLGYLGLDRVSGEIAWRRPADATLSAPLVLAPHDVVLIRECDEAVGAPPGHAVLACFDRIDPIDIAGRAAGRIHVEEAAMGACLAAGGGAWVVRGEDLAALVIGRGVCRFTVQLPQGRARRIEDVAAPAPVADDVVASDGDGVWRQVIAGGRSWVVPGSGARLPGLTVLATARSGDAGAVVVRADASLTRDYLAAYDRAGVVWVWPLPAPPATDGGRGGPVAVATTERDIYVFFDGSRVARFTAPWAGSTDR